MDPSATFCPHLACPDKGRVGQGNGHIHSRHERRYRCTTCGHTFTATTNTPFYRLHHAADLVRLVLTLLAHGGPLPAIVAACALDERTVRSWLHRAGQHGAAFHAQRVQDVEGGQVQADEIRARIRGGAAWIGLALAVPSRLWLGGVVSPRRDGTLVRLLLLRVRACAATTAFLLCVDGFTAYVSAAWSVVRAPRARDGAVGPVLSGRRASCWPRSSKAITAAGSLRSGGASWSGPRRRSCRPLRRPEEAARSTPLTSNASTPSCGPSSRPSSAGAAPPLTARRCSRAGCGSSAAPTTGAGPSRACGSGPSGPATAIGNAPPPWPPASPIMSGRSASCSPTASRRFPCLLLMLRAVAVPPPAVVSFSFPPPRQRPTSPRIGTPHDHA
jgi:transposase-like protein